MKKLRIDFLKIILFSIIINKDVLGSKKFLSRDIENIGNALQFIVPTFAFTRSLYDDRESINQFLKHFISLNATVYLLKYTVKEKRPTYDKYDSFPSGHTAAAFGGATFVHFRYSLNNAKYLYLLSILTAFSRVYSQKHHIQDVIASIGLSFVSSYIFVRKKNDNINYSFNYNPTNKNLLFSLMISL